MRIGGCFVCATGPCQNKPWRPWCGCPTLYSFRYASVASSGGKALSLSFIPTVRLPLLADTKSRGLRTLALNGGAFPALSPVGGGNFTYVPKLEAGGGEEGGGGCSFVPQFSYCPWLGALPPSRGSRPRPGAVLVPSMHMACRALHLM